MRSGYPVIKWWKWGDKTWICRYMLTLSIPLKRGHFSLRWLDKKGLEMYNNVLLPVPRDYLLGVKGNRHFSMAEARRTQRRVKSKMSFIYVSTLTERQNMWWTWRYTQPKWRIVSPCKRMVPCGLAHIIPRSPTKEWSQLQEETVVKRKSIKLQLSCQKDELLPCFPVLLSIFLITGCLTKWLIVSLTYWLSVICEL